MKNLFKKKKKEDKINFIRKYKYSYSHLKWNPHPPLNIRLLIKYKI